MCARGGGSTGDLANRSYRTGEPSHTSFSRKLYHRSFSGGHSVGNFTGSGETGVDASQRCRCHVLDDSGGGAEREGARRRIVLGIFGYHESILSLLCFAAS